MTSKATSTQRDTRDHFNTRYDSERAIDLLTRGLVTPTEAATLAGVSRQLVNFWINRAGLDHASARAQWLRKLWRGRL